MIRVASSCSTAVIASLAPLAAVRAEPATLPAGPGSMLTVGTGLVLVIGAILVTGWLYSRTQKLRGGAGDVIRIVASQPLGTRERVILLQVADQQLLVGMTSTQVQTLHVFDEPVAMPEVAGSGFAGRLRAAVKGQQT